MTEHLPECPEVYIECFGGICDCEYSHVCICTALRACEARVLDAAREAVTIAPMGSGAYNTKAADIAAIDALRKE